LKTENLTIAFVDIKGFTHRTSTQSREDNQVLLARFADVVRPLAAVFGGNVVKSIGDAFLMTFRSPTDALHCSMAIQDRLAGINASLPQSQRFEVRLALSVGEVRMDQGDVFGEPVNVASRIETLADGGDIYFSEAVYLVMNKSEVPFKSAGTHRLKGVPDPVKVFRIPRISEVGDYRLTGDGVSRESLPSKHSLEPPLLPYGGYALDLVRLKAGPRGGGALDEVRAQRGRGRKNDALPLRFRVLIAALVLAIVTLGAWLGWAHFKKSPPPPPKPKTFWEKIFGRH
jgi:class 3 adenylate cyclase